MRPELPDSDIERELARRAAGEWRPERVLPAVRRVVDEPRAEPVTTSRWAALAALVGLLGVLILVAVALPRLDLGPAAPSPTPEGGVVVLSTEEFAARLATGELRGSIVLVDGEIVSLVGSPPPGELAGWACPIGTALIDRACFMGGLRNAEPRIDVYVHSIAVVDDGTVATLGPFPPETEWPSWYRASQPVSGVLLLAVTDEGQVEFAGRVLGDVSAPTTAAADAAALDTALELDEVVLVDGWLTQVGGAISCRPSDPGTVLDGLPDKWCGNPAWIGPEPLAVDPAGVVIPDDFISVQHGAYFGFAEDPAADEQGLLVPRRATYALARRLYGGGCPENQPPCWDWMIVARLTGSASAPVVTPAPLVTQPPETPVAERPPASLTCAHVTRGGRPSTEPHPTLRVIDHSHRIEGCMYLWRPDVLGGDALRVTQASPSSVEVLWAIDQICESEVAIDFSGDEQVYDLAIDYRQGSSCRVGGGVEGFLMWFAEPVEANVIEAYIDRSMHPPSPSAPPATRIECEEITAPAQPDSRRGEAVIIDHSGVVNGLCQWFRAVPSEGDQVTVTNPTGSQTLLEISWPVPMVCDYMPVELEVWRTADGLLVHIDREAVIDQAQACRTETGRQGVALNLAEPMMATSVETVLTTEGAALSVVDMPAAGMTWALSLVPGKAEYAIGELIKIDAILAYDGDMQTRTLVGSGSGLVGFSVGQLDGDLSMGGLRTGDCRPYEIRSGEPLTMPYVKGAGWSVDDPSASFYEEWVRDLQFTLPAGSWRIWASAEFALGSCGGRLVRLDTSIVIHVR